MKFHAGNIMNVEYINPFLTSTINVISTMAFVKLSAGKPYINRSNKATGEVTGSVSMVGLAGNNVIGSVIISFEPAAILEIVTNMLGEEFTEVSSDVEDAIGEITNMIVGGAKRILAEKGYRFNLAIPTVLKGKNIHLNLKTRGPRIVIPFTLESGSTFTVEACIEEH